MNDILQPSDFEEGDLLATVIFKPKNESLIFEVIKKTNSALLVHNPRIGFKELEEGIDFRWVMKVDEKDVVAIEEKTPLWKKVGNWLKKF